MKSIVIALILLLMFPAVLFADVTMGIFFDETPYTMHYYPTHMEEFVGYIITHNIECQLSAVEFALDIPAGIWPGDIDIPEGSLILGDLMTGLSITYWPPLDPALTGYNFLCSIHFLAVDWCIMCGGTLADAPIKVKPSQRGQLPPFLGGTCWPNNEKVEMIGLTSILCPQYIAVEEESWGAIKSLFK